MKKLKIYALCLFFFIVFLILIAWCFVVSTRAQEGCGEWKKVEKVIDHVATMDSFRLDRSIRHCSYYRFIHPDDLEPPCSAWVLKPCPDIATVEEAKVETVYVRDPCPRPKICEDCGDYIRVKATGSEDTFDGKLIFYEFSYESRYEIKYVRISPTKFPFKAMTVRDWFDEWFFKEGKLGWKDTVWVKRRKR